MSNAESLLKKVEGLPPDYMATIFDFIDQLKHKTSPVKKMPTKNRSRAKKPPLAKTAEKLWKLCKDTPITADSLLEMRHEETEREAAEYRRMFHHEGEQ
jgi:hypothetical protein